MSTLDLHLSNPPYLQLAIDIPNLSVVSELLSNIVDTKSSRFLLELGTPLIKNEGLCNVVPVFRQYFPERYLIADLKTLDVGEIEVELAEKSGVNACVVSGLAPIPTIKGFIEACDDFGIHSWVDSLGIGFEPLKSKIAQLDHPPYVIIVHRGIDEEVAGFKTAWDNILHFKSIPNTLIAVAGGLTLDNVQIAKKHGADIFVIGRAIYQSKNPQNVIDQFLSVLVSL